MRRPAALPAVAGLAVAVLLTSGCGNQPQSSASGETAAFTVGLQRVDDALAGHHYVAGRRALRTLITETLAAERAGDLSAADGKRIRAAARRLLALLPEPSVTSTTTASPEASATHSPTRTRTPTATATRPTTRPTPTVKPSSSPSGPPTSAGPSGDPSSSSSSDARASDVADPTPGSDSAG